MPEGVHAVLVVTVVHQPADARIRHRQIGAMLSAGWRVTYAAPWSATGTKPDPALEAVDLPRAAGRQRLAALRAARRLLRARGPSHDIVLLHDPELLVAAAGLHGLPPVVWDVHEDTAAAVKTKEWLPAPARWLAVHAVRALERRAERDHHLLLAEHAYAGRFRGSHPVVPNTVTVPTTVREPGPDRVVYLGALSQARGAADLVAVGRRLREQTGGAVRLELFGQAYPDAIEAVRSAADAGDLVWHGFCPNDVALRRIEGALAGLSLLHDEANYLHSMPTKVAEYMTRGVPVITTPLPLAAQMVEKAQAGRVVPYQDADAVVAAVLDLRDDPVARASAGAAGHDYARAHLSWERGAKTLLDALGTWARTS